MENIFNKIDNFAIFQDVESCLLWGDKSAVSKPIVSIIMPVFNHPEFLKNAIVSAINQDFDKPYEIIVVDNTDLSEAPTINQSIVEEINSPIVLYYRNSRNIGMFGNFNRGIELARSEYVTFLHDDDMLMPNTLSDLFCYSKQVGNGCIIASRLFIDNEGREILKQEKNKKSFLKDKLLYKRNFLDVIYEGSTSPAGEAALWRRNQLMALGGFNIDYYPSSDYALEVCYMYYYGAYYLNKPLLKYRISDNESFNVYSKWYEKDKWILKCLLKKLKRNNFVYKEIVNTKLNIQKITNEIKWGKKNATLINEISIKDKLIMRLFSYFYLISSVKRKKYFVWYK